MSVQPRLIQTDGYAVLSGVQMVVKAGLESGINTLIGAQLDGPAEYADLLSEHSPLLADKGINTPTLPDARQAITALLSAWVTGKVGLGLFDAMGVIDAAGVLLSSHKHLVEPGGVLMCLGDSDTGEGEAAMALLRRAGWVVIEPALQDEVKRFASAGLGLSRVSGRPVALALPGCLMRGAATVACTPNAYPSSGEAKPIERASENTDALSALLAEARGSQINAVVNPPGKDEALPLALITVGRSYGWARQAMAELGLVGRVPMLRMGVLSPPDLPVIERHIGRCRRVLLLDPTGIGIGESLAGRLVATLDEQPQDEAGTDAREQTEVLNLAMHAKAGPAGVIRALRPWLVTHDGLPKELVMAGLARFDASQKIDARDDEVDGGDGREDRREIDREQGQALQLPDRGTTPPPGSSLVDLSVVLGRLRRDLADSQHMLEQHRTGPVDVAIFGELDDAAELLLSRWGELTGGMGVDGRLAGAAAAGAYEGQAKRSVVLMTSRRFFSLGTSAIADAVRAGRDAVFVIHTEDPAEAFGPRRRWQRRPKVNALDMQAIVEGIGVGRRNPTPSVSTIDPSDRPRMGRLLERLVLSDGVHVVIARRRRGPRYYRKASDVHQKQSARRGYVAKQGCLVHCPEAGPLTPRRRIELGVLGVEPTRSGPDPWTVSVSWSWHDETVMHALADPAVGLAILERSQPERSRVVAEDLDDLPDPPKPIHANADAWRATLVGITGSAYDLTLQLLLEAGAAMGYLVRSNATADTPDHPAPRRADILFTRHEQDNLPHVPSAPGRASTPMLTATPIPGQSDLLLGTELAETARLVDSDLAPVSAAHGHALIDTLHIPDIRSLDTGELPDREAMINRARGFVTGPACSRAVALPVARLSEWLWGHQRYAAWVYLGYLVQRGLVPLTTTAIDAAGQRALGMNDPRSAEAVRVGRKLALDPAYAGRALQHDPPDLEAYLRTAADDLAEMAGSRRGTSLAGAFVSMLQPALDQMQGLGDDTRRQLVTTAQRCAYWAGTKNALAYCQRFIDAARHVYQIDNGEHGYALTRAAIDGLDRAMLIPDEVYLAALLTSPQRYRRDRRRFNISLERGDRISYVHLLRPEFDLFKRRVAFTVTLGERAIKTLANLHALRRIRPGWYRNQRDFRDLYLRALTDLTQPKTESAYRHARDLATCTNTIAGRGDNRRATVTKARRKLEKLMLGGEEG